MDVELVAGAAMVQTATRAHERTGRADRERIVANCRIEVSGVCKLSKQSREVEVEVEMVGFDLLVERKKAGLTFYQPGKLHPGEAYPK
jgi:hypothetical protein